jgi:hypothetical protein
MKTYAFFYLVVLTFFTLQIQSCGKDETPTPPVTPTPETNEYGDINNTMGFELLNKINGIWNGPVTSSTPLGGYPEWIVDFRPISENQVCAKNELDTLNDIFMSFFIAKYNDEYKLAFRNGGSFNGNKRVSYFICDSVSESTTNSFYRFVEIIKGQDRAYTDVVFVDDSLYIKSYTNNYNAQPTATYHMIWSAKLQDLTSCAAAISNFDFPKKTLTKDFSTSFSGVSEAVYYGTNSIPAGDPYPEVDHPYLGQTTINYNYSGAFTPDPAKKVFIMITTQPLINGFSINSANLSTRSRYVILSSTDQSFTFNYMHPGTYYVYALYDGDSNMNFSSGDWVSATNTSFTLSDNASTSASIQINFTIP